MEITVIIPTFKDTSRLELCLDALLSQKFDSSKFEVIVVNNDPIEKLIIHETYFKNLNLRIENEIIPGSYAARNKGLKLAKSDIIAFTDSDCIPDSDWLRNGLKYFEQDSYNEIGILAGNVSLFFRNPDNLNFAEIYEKHAGFSIKNYVKTGHTITANWFSYKAVLEEFGGFNSQLKSNGDTELSGIISKKYKLKFASDVVVKHPARHRVKEIVHKYRRLLGGTYQRRFPNLKLKFFLHLIHFSWRRLRFSLKKFFTVSFKESFAIFVVCMAINLGAWKEYFNLIYGGDTKR
jgi:glycosyltransferase involved in cell wall biosynthesis